MKISRTGKGLLAGGAVAAGAGMFFGVRSSDDDIGIGEKTDRGLAFAGLAAGGAVVAGTAARGVFRNATLTGAGKSVLSGSQSAAKMTHDSVKTFAKSPRGAFRNNTAGFLMGGGAALGAAVGGYAADDTLSGAAKGAAIGTGVGGAAQLAYLVHKKTAAFKNSGASHLHGKAGMVGLATVAAVAIGFGSHALSNQSSESSYAYTGEGGETKYSDSPLKRRMESMNASGDVVLGRHRSRHG